MCYIDNMKTIIPAKEVKNTAKKIVNLATRWDAEQVYLQVQLFDGVVALAVTHSGTVSTSGNGCTIRASDNIWDAIHVLSAALVEMGFELESDPAFVVNPLTVNGLSKSMLEALC